MITVYLNSQILTYLTLVKSEFFVSLSDFNEDYKEYLKVY